MAVKLAKATKTTADSWINLQSKLDLWKSEQKDINVILFPTVLVGTLNLTYYRE